MATITITVPNESIALIVEAFAYAYNYTPDPNLPPATPGINIDATPGATPITNPQIEEFEFMRQQILLFIQNVVSNYLTYISQQSNQSIVSGLGLS